MSEWQIRMTQVIPINEISFVDPSKSSHGLRILFKGERRGLSTHNVVEDSFSFRYLDYTTKSELLKALDRLKEAIEKEFPD